MSGSLFWILILIFKQKIGILLTFMYICNFLVRTLLQKIIPKFINFALLHWVVQTVQTVEFMLSNVVYKTAVYKTGITTFRYIFYIFGVKNQYAYHNSNNSSSDNFNGSLAIFQWSFEHSETAIHICSIRFVIWIEYTICTDYF